MELDHINITPPQEKLDEMKNFYCKVLGLTNGYRPFFNSPGYWLYAEEKAILHLTGVTRTLEKSSENYLDHFAVRKEGLSEFLETLNENGVKASIKANIEREMTQVFFFDPCGVKVEVSFSGELHDDAST